MPETNDFVAAYARAIVADCAPHELPLFRPVSSAYFADPDAVFHRNGAGTLAFGDATAATAYTPFILAVINAVTVYLMQELVHQGAKQPDPSRFFAAPDKARSYRGALLSGMQQAFSLDELRSLCFELTIDHDSIGDVAEEQFARTLIEYCERHGLLETLIANCERLRPQVIFRPPAPAAESAPGDQAPATRISWTTEQLKKVRAIVIDVATRLEVPDPTGPDLANQLVLGMVMA